MASDLVPVTFVADELLTSTKMNILAANQIKLRDGTGLGDGIIVTRHLGDSVKLKIPANTLDLTATDVPFSSSTGFTITGSVKAILDKKIIFGTLAINGSFTTAESSVGHITLPSIPGMDMVYRGAADGTSNRVATAWINSSGTITVQAPDNYTGNVWFTFVAVLL